MCALGVARLGLSVKEIYELTPAELFTALQIQDDQSEYEFRNMMEVARYISFHIWNSAGKGLKRQQSDPQKLLPLPWDKKKQREIQSPKDMLATMFGIARTHNKTENRKNKKK